MNSAIPHFHTDLWSRTAGGLTFAGDRDAVETRNVVVAQQMSGASVDERPYS